MRAYLDSSSFAKRFVDEAGSEEVELVCADASELALSVLCVPEIISALNRRLREHTLSKAHYDTAKRRLIEDIRDVNIINLTDAIVTSSIGILEKSPIRTLDALHIACALGWAADVFVSSDKQQLAAARRVGLRTKRV
jgi:predicted nucleic acid-binding protein